MCDPILVGLAVAMPDLTVLYWVCMIVGGGLLVFSLLGAADGHADVEIDTDVSLDAHTDLEADASAGTEAHADHDGAASLATWFSVRFLIYFLAVFGVVGVVFTHLTDAGGLATLGVSAGGGLVAGQGVHQLFRKLRQSSGNSAIQVTDYVNKLGRVSITITYPHKGEIVLPVRSTERYIAAVAKHPDTTLNVGEQVAVVAYHAGVAEVVSRKEFEFLTDNQQEVNNG